MPVRSTSLLAYEDLRDDLARREQLVLDALGDYHHHYQAWPTGYELFAFMQRDRWAVTDLNSVRPRLTELRQAHRVHNPGKRRCAVTGRLALVWQVSDGRLF